MIWFPCTFDGFDHYYVSNDGLVKNSLTGRIIKPSINKYGYHRYDLRSRGTRIQIYAHRLVMITFSPNPRSRDLEVNHIDRDKSNNHIDNLEWCTHAENMDHYHSSREDWLDFVGVDEECELEAPF